MVSAPSGVGAEVVLDANVVGALAFTEADHAKALEVFRLVAAGALTPVVPGLFWAEFHHICGKKLHGSGLTPSQVDRVYEDAMDLPLVEIAVLSELRDAAWQLRKSLRVGSYDAYHLALAHALGTEVWTFDQAFRDRASSSPSVRGTVRLVGVDVLP